MNRPLLIGTAFACGLGTACPAGPDPPPALWPGELAFLADQSYGIEHAGSLIFQNYGSSIYSLSVADPAQPESTDYDAYGAIACNTACNDFGFLLNYREMSIVPLPDAALPALIYGFDDPATWSATDIAVLPHPALAIGRVASANLGEILLVDLASGSPEIVQTILTDYAPERVVSDGDRIFSFPWVVSGDPRPNEVVVYDASVLTSAQEIARISVTLPGELVLEHIAVAGRDLFVVSTRDRQVGGDEGGFVGWYRFSDDFTSLTEMAVSTSYSPTMTRTARIVGRHAFFGNLEIPEPDYWIPEKIVLVLDSQNGFVETSRAPYRWGVSTDLDIDEDRGLVYLGGQGLQIYDLGILTGGTARWPTASTPEGATLGLGESAL